MKDILFNKNYTCVAVSKTKPTEEITKIYDLGHRNFGENKVQELEFKYESLPKDIKWHMIGHLQSNKVKKVIPIVSLIHSVDSLKLLKTINKESKKIDKTMDCLIQVNISNENSKFGFIKKELEFLNQDFLNDFKYIKIRGLMGMASFTNNEKQIRKEFKYLKEIFDDFNTSLDDFNILSMGMSNDYNIALEYGSNMVRIGSKIFGKRNYH
tara:strand:- start:71 stop:703 length:633 start_codon:yes stop_codon:yes gene_type:complete